MIKFSVKKPLTVLVAVIAILVLGFVSFTSMTPDLLPSIDMPYVMLITTYPGATPEKVETVVTKPLEQVMATLDKIEQVSSTSSESYSQVVLQFAEDVNMDTVTVDILQRIQQVSEYWDEMVGTPYIMKINPSMLPVMITAVEMEGMDNKEMSAFAQEVLLPKLEGTTGVASIEAEGIVEETINVVLSQNKIDAQNDAVRAAIDGQFAEAEAELEKAENELRSKLRQLQGKMAEIEDGIAALAGKAADGTSEVDKKQREILETKLAIYQQIYELEEQKASLEQQEQLLGGLQTRITQLESSEGQLNAKKAALEGLDTELTRLNGLQTAFDAEIAGIQGSAMSDADKQTAMDAVYARQDYLDMVADFGTLDANLAAWGTDRAGLAVAVLDTQTAQTTVQAALATVDGTLAALSLTRGDVTNALTELRSGIGQIEQGIVKLETVIAQLEAGSIMASQAQTELEKQKTLLTYQMNSATAQLMMAEDKLKQALDEVENALEDLKEAKESAYEAANLDTLVTMGNVAQLLQAQNFSMPAGYVEQAGQQVMVRVGDTFGSLEELQDMVLFDFGMEDLAPIRLSDVADVFISDNADTIYAKLDGNNGVLLSFTKQSTYATAEVSGNIQARMDELSEEYEGLRFVPLMDQGDYIYLVVNAILENLLLGALFAIIILFLFLRDLRPTFITLCSIPISVVFAIVLMYFSGVTINIISLSGLAVAVGMLVDNSVVVIENIYRLRSRGASAVKAAVSGTAQVSGAIAASTLTTVCVFLPIVFTEGLTRQLFTDMALTIGYSLIASLIVALTLVPAMAANVLKKTKDYEGKVFKKTMGGYQKSLKWALGHKAVVLVAVVLLLAVSIGGVVARGFILMPEMDMAQLTVTMTMPDEADSDDTKQMADTVTERIEGVEEVQTVGAMMTADDEVTMYVLTDEKARRSSSEISAAIEEACADLGCTVEASGSVNMGGMLAGGGTGVSVNLYGDDLDELQQAARDVAAKMQGVEGLESVEDGIGETSPEIRFIVDKDKAMKEGITVAQVYAQVSQALTTERTSTAVTYEGETYDVIIINGEEAELTPAYVRNYTFTVTTMTGESKTIRLGDIAEVVQTETANSIRRLDQRRYITVSGVIADGYNVSLVTGEVEKALATQALPAGISMEFTGENESIMDSFGELAKMLALGVLLVYLIMVAQFQSLKSPFIVMFTIPLAFTGGLLALLITGNELSVIALIGFVMLVGIIVNNGIVLVDYINQLRAGGMDRQEAILDAGTTRMRPILMTSLTTILGLSVMAFGVGMGAALMQPIAIVCIGGLAYATLLTLYVIPIIYDMLNKKKLRMVDDAELELLDDEEWGEASDSLLNAAGEDTPAEPMQPEGGGKKKPWKKNTKEKAQGIEETEETEE